VRRRRGLVLALVAGLVALTCGSVAAPVRAAQPSAIQQLGACLDAAKAGDVLLLVDQSGSLQKTDPKAVRVTASAYLIRQLAAYADQSKVALDLAVSGFDVGYQKVVPWTRLAASNADRIARDLQTFADRDKGVDTDYVSALQGARADLRSRQPAGAATSRCQALLWFSDGQFDIEPRTTSAMQEKYGTTKPYAPGVSLTSSSGTQQAEQLGRTALCRRGGLADQLRGSGLLTFGVGLGTDPGTFSLMRNLSTGPGCGRPTANVVGDFRLASDVDSLIFALAALSTPGTSSLDLRRGVCPRVACTSQAHQFVLDASIRAVSILAGANAPGIDVVIAGPGSSKAARFHYNGLQQSTINVAGTPVTARWLSDRTLELHLAKRADAGWVGQWSVVFVDVSGSHPRATSRTQIRITGDLVPAVVGTLPALRSEDTADIRLGLASEATHQPVPAASVLGTAALDVSLVAAGEQPKLLATGLTPRQLARPLRVDLAGFQPGAATLRLVLSVRTRGLPAAGGRPAVPGTQLSDRQVDVPVTVLPPPGYPTVAPRVDFGHVEGVGPFTASLKVSGPGCAWLQATDVTAEPDADSGVAVTSPHASPATCLKVAEGATAELPLTLKLAKAGNGNVLGSLQVGTLPAAGNRGPKSARVAFSGDVTKPANVKREIAVFLIALLLGIGLPLLFLYAAKRWAARIPGPSLVVGRVPVTVTGNNVLRDGVPLSLRMQDMQFLPVPARGTRSLDIRPLHLRTRTGWSLTGTGWTEVTAPQPFVTSQTDGRLPLSVQKQWIAMQDPSRPQGAELVVLLSGTANSDAALEEIARDVRGELPARCLTLPGAAPAEPAQGGWGSGPEPSEPAPGGWGATPSAPPAPGWGSAPSPGAPPPSPGWGAPPSPPSPPSTPPPSGGWGDPPTR
jgi:hypothetical protein